MIRAVVFDIDDTLVDFSGATGRGLLAHLATTAPVSTADTDRYLALWRHLERIHFNAYLRGEYSFTEQRRRRAREFCATAGFPLGPEEAEVDAWVSRYLAHCDRAFVLFPDVLPALDTLDCAELRLAAMSNSDRAYQDRKLTALGIRHRMETLVCCDDVGGVAKPDPRIFHAVCDRLGIAPAEAVYVGDRLDSDARAAIAAGLTGVWLDRTGNGHADVPIITTLDELGRVLPARTVRKGAR
ncbi:HAD family hydrolase [Micromonospora sp. WMMD1082]|uniref:HAD family hydrolase n=1 Tax=Micromonospora sp. WMMD1082 TaxID=3016104 RepID=UPI00241690B3|nr:HAD family hydrolase [Micromonospora sp. WMMD1082]MDG4797044.1 HAD family hydrolase [Micromonospora sp. WMMD1082]